MKHIYRLEVVKSFELEYFCEAEDSDEAEMLVEDGDGFLTSGHIDEDNAAQTEVLNCRELTESEMLRGLPNGFHLEDEDLQRWLNRGRAFAKLEALLLQEFQMDAEMASAFVKLIQNAATQSQRPQATVANV